MYRVSSWLLPPCYVPSYQLHVSVTNGVYLLKLATTLAPCTGYYALQSFKVLQTAAFAVYSVPRGVEAVLVFVIPNAHNHRQHCASYRYYYHDCYDQFFHVVPLPSLGFNDVGWSIGEQGSNFILAMPCNSTTYFCE